MRRLPSAIAGAGVVVVLLILPLGGRAASPPSPSKGASAARSIAVSAPGVFDPVTVTPGLTAQMPIRLLNPGSAPVTVTVRSHGIIFGDDGKVGFTNAPDPRWAGIAAFPPGEITIPAGAYIGLSIAVQIPANLTPDLYYVGFIVSPVPTAAEAVLVINQIGDYVVLDVPGPRVRAVSADLAIPGFAWGPIHIGSLVVGDHVDGELTVHNIGRSSVLFFGENDPTSGPITGAPAQQRFTKSLLPIGRSRSRQVTARPGFPIDFSTMTATVTYPDRTETGTKQLIVTRTVLVITPWVSLLLGLLIAVMVGWPLRLRHRRRAAGLAAAAAAERRRRLGAPPAPPAAPGRRPHRRHPRGQA